LDKPGSPAAWIPQAGCPLPHGGPDLLGHVVERLAIAEHAVNHRSYPGIMPAQKFLEGVSISRPDGLDQR
jgi:hypothetical protein